MENSRMSSTASIPPALCIADSSPTKLALSVEPEAACQLTRLRMLQFLRGALSQPRRCDHRVEPLSPVRSTAVGAPLTQGRIAGLDDIPIGSWLASSASERFDFRPSPNSVPENPHRDRPLGRRARKTLRTADTGGKIHDAVP